jgi:hypothetical protein
MPSARSAPADVELGEREAQDSEAEALLGSGNKGNADGVLSASGLRVRRTASLPPGETVFSDAAAALDDEGDHAANPTINNDLPLRALAQGLSLLSLEELRRLHLPHFPWQSGEDGAPSLLENLRKKPWKAHYTSLLGFVLSSRARARRQGQDGSVSCQLLSPFLQSRWPHTSSAPSSPVCSSTSSRPPCVAAALLSRPSAGRDSPLPRSGAPETRRAWA